MSTDRLVPADPEFAEVIRASFARQSFSALIGAELTSILPGRVEISLNYRDDLLQQRGYLHGAVIAAIADNACGYAAQTLAPAGTSVLAIELKINFLEPA